MGHQFLALSVRVCHKTRLRIVQTNLVSAFSYFANLLDAVCKLTAVRNAARFGENRCQAAMHDGLCI